MAADRLNILEPTTDIVRLNAAQTHKAQALQALKSGQIEDGITHLETALANQPVDAGLIRQFRHLEMQLGEEYRAGREEAYLQVVNETWGTYQWPDTVVKLATFWDAPKLMEWLKAKTFETSYSTREPSPEGPRVSFIVPVYNDLDLLGETLDSIKRQTVPDWEILLIDDGSRPEIAEQLDSIVADTDHCRVVHHEQNSGLPAARNTGCREALTEFVVWLDADDLISPLFLEKTLNAADQHPQAAWISGLTCQFGFVNRLFGFAPFDLNELVCQNQFNCTMLLRRCVWEDLGGLREEMRHGYEDWEFWIRATRNGYRPLQLKELLFFYRRREGSMLDLFRSRDTSSTEAKLQLIESNAKLYQPMTAEAKHLLASQPSIPESLIRREVVRQIMSRPAEVPGQASPSPSTKPATSASLGEVKRVLLVVHDFPPYRYVGALLYAQSIGRALMDLGIHVEVFHPTFRGEYPPDFKLHTVEFEGMTVHRLAMPDIPEHERILVPQVHQVFKQFLEENAFDVVHVHGLGRLSAAPLLAARELGIPTAYTFHDFWPVCIQWFMMESDIHVCSGPESAEKCAQCYMKRIGLEQKGPLLKNMTEVMGLRSRVFLEEMKHLDLAIAPSEYYQKKLIEAGVPNVQVNRNGMLPANRLPKRQQPRFTFGHIGQVSVRKGGDILLRAFADPALSDCELRIHGNMHPPAYETYIRNIADKLPNVKLLGAYTPDQLGEIMAELDVIVIPTRMDNYPLTVLEAYQHGTPVITSDAGGVPEMVEHGKSGYIFPSENVAELRRWLIHAKTHRDEISAMRDQLPHVRTMEDDAFGTLVLYHETMIKSSSTAKSQPVPSHEPEISTDDSGQSVRALFYFFKNVHVPILLPVWEEAKRRGWQTAFAIHPYDRTIRAGFSPDEEREFRKTDAQFIDQPVSFKPDVTFMADNVAPLLTGCGRIVNVGHGLLSKGQYFTDTDIIHRENLSDLLCVPGSYHRDRLLASNRVFLPVVATGFPKLDALFRDDGLSRDERLFQAGLDPSKRYLLYAPTFNVELSAIPILWMRIAELVNDSTELLIKLHGSSSPEYKQAHKQLAEKHAGIHYIEDADLAPAMRLADVMISDVSSAFMEFIALDKPVVLFNNPNVASYVNYDPRDIEYTWRGEIGIEANTLEEVKEAVARSLANPAEFAEARAKYADQLLADRTGGSAAAVLNAATELLEHGNPQTAQPLAECVVLIPVESPDKQRLQQTITSLDHVRGVRVRPVVVSAGFVDDTVETVHPDRLPAFFDQLTTDSFIAVARPGVQLDNDKLFRLINHLRRDPARSSVSPLVIEETAAENPFNYLNLPESLKNQPELLDRKLRVGVQAKGQQVQGKFSFTCTVCPASDDGKRRAVACIQQTGPTNDQRWLAFDVVLSIDHIT